MSRDAALALLTLAVAAAYYALAVAIPPSDLADAVGPQGLPVSYAMVLGGLSLVLLVRSTLVRMRAGVAARPGEVTTPASESATRRHRGWRVAGMLLIGAGYVAVVPWLGYAVTIGLLLALTTWYQGGIFGRRVAIVAVAGALLFWLLFVQLLGIAQPSGLWPDLFTPSAT